MLQSAEVQCCLLEPAGSADICSWQSRSVRATTCAAAQLVVGC